MLHISWRMENLFEINPPLSAVHLDLRAEKKDFLPLFSTFLQLHSPFRSYPQFIWQESKLLAPVEIFFDQLVQTVLWAISAEQHAPYIRFMPRPAKKGIECIPRHTGTLGLKFSHFYMKTPTGLSWVSNDR